VLRTGQVLQDSGSSSSFSGGLFHCSLESALSTAQAGTGEVKQILYAASFSPRLPGLPPPPSGTYGHWKKSVINRALFPPAVLQQTQWQVPKEAVEVRLYLSGIRELPLPGLFAMANMRRDFRSRTDPKAKAYLILEAGRGGWEGGGYLFLAESDRIMHILRKLTDQSRESRNSIQCQNFRLQGSPSSSASSVGRGPTTRQWSCSRSCPGWASTTTAPSPTLPFQHVPKVTLCLPSYPPPPHTHTPHPPALVQASRNCLCPELRHRKLTPLCSHRWFVHTRGGWGGGGDTKFYCQGQLSIKELLLSDTYFQKAVLIYQLSKQHIWFPQASSGRWLSTSFTPCRAWGWLQTPTPTPASSVHWPRASSAASGRLPGR